MEIQQRSTSFSIFLLIVVSSGGLLFGYHTAIFSGILNTVTKNFNLSLFDQGFLVSIVLLGGLCGALTGGFFADSIGRKKTLLVTAAIFCVSTLIQAFSTSYYILLAGRFLAGIGVGFSSVISPMYLAEIAPPARRGAFVSVYQFMVATGILWAYAMDMVLEEAWRWVFYIGFIPAALQFVLLFFIPESPSWLAKHEHINPKNSHKSQNAPHYLRKLLFLGLVLSIFQQITGVNTVFYYAPKVLIQSGAVKESASLVVTFLLGIANLLFTCIAIVLLDKLGRRIFLLIGVLLMIIGQGFLAFSYVSSTFGIGGVILYVIGFSIGLGPITWVLLSEIFPLKIRGKAMGLALFANWLSNYIITLSFLFLLKELGMTKTFLLYGAISVVCLLFIYFYIPETKGKTLDEIEDLVKH